MSHFTWDMIWSLATAALVSFVAIPPIISVAKAKSLVAIPNGRTSHNGAVPSLGGIAIFAGLLMGASLFVHDGFSNEFQYLIPAFLIIFFIGLKDDIVDISWSTRLTGQLIAAFLVVVMAGVRITTFHGMFGVNEIPETTSIVFSIFVFVSIVNAYNLIDGIDGLASGLGMIASLAFGIWLLKLGYADYGVLAFALLGGLIPFYIYNVFGKKNKLFMGDTGSTLMGTVFAILAMKILCCDLPAGHILDFNALPALVIAVMVIPVSDTIRIFTVRILKGKSPFSADRNHFHHYLLRLGMNHWQASTAIIALNIIILLIAFMMREWSAKWVVVLTVGPTILIIMGVKFIVDRGVELKRPAVKPTLRVYPD